MSKLCLFVPNLHGGGAEKMMVHLANEFTRCNHSCDLVLAQAQGAYMSRIDGHVNVTDLHTSFRNPLVIVRLARHLRHSKPDAVLTAMTYPNFAALLARKLARTEMRIVVSERVALSVQSGHTPGLREKLKPVAARLTYRFADHIVAISNGVADDLSTVLDIDGGRISTIYNPVITGLELRRQEEPEHPWFREHAVPVLLAAGRLVRQKDFATLLHAFARVREQQDVRLIILGEGPERGRLTQLAQDLGITAALDMPGYTPNLYAFMQHSDLFVLSSAWEGFGNVLVEALACGCPVVSTDCPSGPAEILDGGRYGRLVPAADPAALRDAILASLDKPPHRETLRTRATVFSAETSARKYLEVLLPARSL